MSMNSEIKLHDRVYVYSVLFSLKQGKMQNLRQTCHISGDTITNILKCSKICRAYMEYTYSFSYCVFLIGSLFMYWPRFILTTVSIQYTEPEWCFVHVLLFDSFKRLLT